MTSINHYNNLLILPILLLTLLLRKRMRTLKSVRNNLMNLKISLKISLNHLVKKVMKTFFITSALASRNSSASTLLPKATTALGLLCDAVMGFLSGVLSNIKEHLGQHKDEIDIAIEALKQNKHAGKNGFNAAIGRVVAGVRGYNEKVRDSNECAKTPIRTLMKYVKPVKGELNKTLNDIQVVDDPRQVEEQVSTAKALVATSLQKYKEYETQYRDVTKHINDLYSQCKTSIHNAHKVVSHETTRLEQLASREATELEATEKMIRETLTALETQVVIHIKREVNALVEGLKGLIKNVILKDLTQISVNLQSHVKDLKKWIEEADEMLKKPIKDAWEIEEKLPGGDKQDAIKEKAKQVDEWKQKLDGYITSVKSNLGNLATEAAENLKKLDKVYKEKLLEIAEAVREVPKAIVELGRQFPPDAVVGIAHNANKNVGDITNHIRLKIGKIKGGSRVNKGLEDIEITMQNYAIKYTQAKFASTVHGWVDGIVDSDGGLVKQWVGEYAKYSTNEKYYEKFGKSAIDVERVIAEQIKMKVKEAIQPAIEGAEKQSNATSAGDDRSIQQNVQAIQTCVNGFVTNVEAKLTKRNSRDGIKVSELAKRIEKDALSTSDYHSHLTNRSHLYDAVEATLNQLVALAKSTSNQLGEFFYKQGSITIGSIVGIIRPIAAELYVNLNASVGRDSDGSIARDKPNLAGKVDSAITAMTEQVTGIQRSSAGNEVDLGDNSIESVRKAPYNDLDRAINSISGYSNGDLDVSPTTTALAELSKQIGENLERLKDAFAYKGKTIKMILDKFQKSNIANGRKDASGSLQAIHDHLEELLTGPVTDAIKHANEIIGKDAPTLQAEYIKYMEKSVGDEVKQAIDKLTTHARKQYVSSVKSLLSDFSSKVYGDIKNLTVSINQDSSLGYKEFMDKFEKHFLKGDTSLEAITSLKATSSTGQKSAMSQATSKFNTAMKAFFDRWEKQTEFASDYKAITPAKEALRKLLAKLVQSQHFDHEFCNNLDALTDELDKFTPGKFGQPNTVLSQAFKEGFADLASVLGRAYVSVYDGGQGISKWLTKSDTQLTDEGRKGAKVCLTIIHLLGVSLPMLRVNCKSLSGQQINKNGDLGKLFADEGYRVSDRGEQNGELQDQDWMKGDQIQKRLTWPISGVNNEHLKLCESTKKHDKFSLIDIMSCLVGHLGQYNDVCHIAPPSKGNAPCNVYQMLCWLDGLPHSPVYQDLIIDGFSGLFEKPGEQHKDVQSDDLPVIDENADTLDAYPKPITAAALRATLDEVCKQSHNVLTSILGYGHAGGVYACEFTNNSQGLVYPNNMNSLICTLVDILRRLHYQLYFICQQLLHDKKLNGWRDCWYGYQVAGSTWQCNTLQCPEQRANQEHKQTCDQKCDQDASCGLKSPLQAFLEDGLHGFLPHRVSSKGLKMTCSSCSKAPGMPCITPMGFADIGNMASHRRMGRHIYMVLTDFCSAEYSPLTKLCSQLTCLLSSAPTTLGDMFAFYYHFLSEWCRGSKGIRDKHREIAFGVAVSRANFKNPSTKLDITSMFKTNVHGFGHSASHFNGDLNTLVSCNPTTTATSPCGSYLKPLNRDIRSMFAEDNADKYLSWIVYLTETFYKLLEQLYADCCNNCNKPGARCHGRSCDKECMMKAGFVMNDTMPTHSQVCRSIVNCTMTLPTLRKYGLYFESKSHLNGKNLATKRTCEDFCKALAQVVKQGNALYVLVHKTIPEFLFTIRQPFIWLNVALWSLSLFYLICVMVGRLDVLHIKSHLRSPSSHRITAQSLLAAAQVGRLAKISYLQP
ncbi:hypothetical protein, conserved [Babesia bigemina]|uniref:C3H1-type domain-containing protein n=1 Tax=Babesia bigemina TaxID=5866 RepID=A0A061BQ22_BABBI|nr:hypothetical protein, conserved [Babesia bigemina]CDR71577.1 hypothetical protein, conserved [Babesia bigemina]|eukprot:XP_012770523.1 hypothetical protein, conserved [Babesia bigemina]